MFDDFLWLHDGSMMAPWWLHDGPLAKRQLFGRLCPAHLRKLLFHPQKSSMWETLIFPENHEDRRNRVDIDYTLLYIMTIVFIHVCFNAVQ
jgi:hypothetical protein